jgi:L-arabinose isomerase
MLEEHGYAGFSFHFDSIGGDGRFRQLPLLAASDLMADGYGYAAEGDTNTATLMCAAQTLIGEAHFSEIYAMDWELDSVLISHMGEGNWKLARKDRPIKLIDRPLGIGGLENPPTPVFSAEPGIATTAALVPLEGELYRLVVGHGEVLDTPELPNVEMHYFHFRPERGMEAFMDEWLRLGAPHHFVTNLGDHCPRWRRFAELLDLEYEEI